MILNAFNFRKFDLKGSTVDREASEKELEKHLPTFKDNDFIKQKVKLEIGEEPKKKLLDTLNNDINVGLFYFFKLFIFTSFVFMFCLASNKVAHHGLLSAGRHTRLCSCRGRSSARRQCACHRTQREQRK